MGLLPFPPDFKLKPPNKQTKISGAGQVNFIAHMYVAIDQLRQLPNPTQGLWKGFYYVQVMSQYCSKQIN